MVLLKAFEERPDVVDVESRAEDEHNDVIEVGGNVCNVFGDLIDDLDEPCQRGTTALSMTSHLKSRVGVKSKVRGMMSLSMVI